MSGFKTRLTGHRGGRSFELIIKSMDKLAKQNAELIEALESTSRELHMTIEEVNYHRIGKVSCLTETEPDLWDMETLHDNQVLVAKIKGEL